jgi:hypothetical protein
MQQLLGELRAAATVARARSLARGELAAAITSRRVAALRGARDRVERPPARELGRVDVGLIVGLEATAGDSRRN